MLEVLGELLEDGRACKRIDLLSEGRGRRILLSYGRGSG